MNTELNDLDLIDLLSERHVQLRLLCENLWNQHHDLPISNSEWFIIARIYKSHPTISNVAKHVGITRQAAHKLIRKMASKGLVEIRKSQHNNKEKSLSLTEFGEACFTENESIKADLIKQITERIGTEHVSTLKHLLQLDWGLPAR